MKLYGIPLLPACERYFEAVYGVKKVDDVCGIPIFKDAEAHFVGGYKNLYTVVEGDASPAVEALAAWRPARRPVRDSFSTESDPFRAKRRHYLLAVPPGTSVESHFALYRGKTRNQVKKSLRLITDVREEPRPPGFYELYARTVWRLGSVPRPASWFERLEEHLGAHAHVISAYHEGALIGANYFIQAGDYALLIFNVSDASYWRLDVNDRLYDAYIASALSRGVRLIDFGPGMATDVSHAHFKMGFGAQERFVADRLFASPLYRVREAARGLLPRIRRRLARALRATG